MLYRLIGSEPRVVVDDAGNPETLTPTRDYDSDDPADAAVLGRWRDFFYAPNSTPERATAAPGEKRAARKR